MSKANQPETDDKFNELVDCFVQLHKHEYFNVMERKDTMADSYTILPPRNPNVEHGVTVNQRATG